MNTKLRFSLASAAFCCLISSDIMALQLPDFGGGGSTQPTTTASQDVLVLTCRNARINTAGSSTGSSCSTSGSTSSSCSSSSTPSTLPSELLSWEMTTTDNSTLQDKLNAAANCTEAVQAAGVSNCEASGGNDITVYTCKIQ